MPVKEYSPLVFLISSIAQLVQYPVAHNGVEIGRKGSIGINETAALPNYSESILKTSSAYSRDLRKRIAKYIRRFL